MKKSICLWQFVGFVFSSVLGVLLHFLFDWTGGSLSVAPFSAVNESIWEHMKLLFFPMFAFAIIENRYMGKEYPYFWRIKLIGIVLGVVLIPVFYYTSNGAFGKAPDWVNIVIFFVSAGVSYVAGNWLFKQAFINCKWNSKALFTLWMIALIFVIFTFFPPEVSLFRDPVTGGYHNIFHNSTE